MKYLQRSTITLILSWTKHVREVVQCTWMLPCVQHTDWLYSSLHTCHPWKSMYVTPFKHQRLAQRLNGINGAGASLFFTTTASAPHQRDLITNPSVLSTSDHRRCRDMSPSQASPFCITRWLCGCLACLACLHYPDRHHVHSHAAKAWDTTVIHHAPP